MRSSLDRFIFILFYKNYWLWLLKVQLVRKKTGIAHGNVQKFEQCNICFDKTKKYDVIFLPG